MSIINKILESDARPQPLSPLFTRLPVELRLMIYTFVSMGCQVSFKLKVQIWQPGDPEGPRRHGCRYKHIGGGFELLRTCRMAYIEAFDTYWSEAVLRVGYLRRFEACCDYLPTAIKANVRHIRTANLYILGGGSVGDPHRVPAQFAEFPKLISCAFWNCTTWAASYEAGVPCMMPVDSVLKVPDTEISAQGYQGVGPFHLKSGESPAAYIEPTIGIRLSDKVTILSYGWGRRPRDCPRDYERKQYFNWATGMVFQTTGSDLKFFTSTAEEDAYQRALRARPGDEWSRSYYVLD